MTHIWAASWQNQQNGMCTQRRLRSAWASAWCLVHQSDQSLRCQHEESLGPQLPIERTAKTDQTGQMPRLPRLIWIFAGRTDILLVLSWGGSFSLFQTFKFAVVPESKLETYKSTLKVVTSCHIYSAQKIKLKVWNEWYMYQFCSYTYF